LAKESPASLEWITTNGRHEIDTPVSPEQYILSINIKRVKDKDERSVNLVAKDLDTLIKIHVNIDSGTYSNYLEYEYEDM
jgi:hypothetical protein